MLSKVKDDSAMNLRDRETENRQKRATVAARTVKFHCGCGLGHTAPVENLPCGARHTVSNGHAHSTRKCYAVIT